jgi:nucleosome assembly protein 1-like 1
MDVEGEQTASLSEELLSESEDEATPMKMTNNAVTKEMLKNPALLSALQGKLDSMAGTKSGYIESLPPAVRRRIKSLKKLQLETTKIEAKFYEEVHQLECKYHDHYTPLYEKRAQISKGTYEPTEVECDWPSEDEELADEIKDKVKLDGEKKDEEKKDDEPPPKGIPEFWLTIFKNVDMLQEMVQEHDEPVLAALTDVKVTFSDGSNQSSPMGFKLHFYFEPNEYFTNSELTKEYEMKCAPPEGDPFSFDGPEIYRCKGCAINWKQGKNLTVKTVKKKQKHKSKGNVRTITKQVKNDSFFNFFDPPPLPEDPEAEVDAETQELLTADFEIGHYIRERIIPRAVLFFTGEALEEDDYDEEEEEEGSDGEEGEDEEDDPDFDPSKVKGGENPQECKQQ